MSSSLLSALKATEEAPSTNLLVLCQLYQQAECIWMYGTIARTVIYRADVMTLFASDVIFQGACERVGGDGLGKNFGRCVFEVDQFTARQVPRVQVDPTQRVGDMIQHRVHVTLRDEGGKRRREVRRRRRGINTRMRTRSRSASERRQIAVGGSDRKGKEEERRLVYGRWRRMAVGG